MFSRLWLGNSISFTMGNIFWWQVKEKTKMGSYNREKVDERKIVSILQNDEWN